MNKSWFGQRSHPLSRLIQDQIVQGLQWKTIDQPEVAKMLAVPQQARFIFPFLRGAKTIKDAAQQLNIPLNQMYKETKKFEKAGLIRVVKTIARPGRAIKSYQAVAEAFFIPYRHTPKNTFEELLRQSHAHWHQLILDGLLAQYYEMQAQLGQDLGIRIYENSNGLDYYVNALGSGSDGTPGLILSFCAPDQPAVWNGLHIARLTPARAKELQMKLALLFQEYIDDTQGAEYGLHIQLTPLKK
ncbi:MAG: helix-turn-helix transcriptional regulator [Pleurocapsa sp. SU_196_0]|nr:helix-turn-helix transcriptional regulator [Pleurocapsa sp. SU_196_0]